MHSSNNSLAPIRGQLGQFCDDMSPEGFCQTGAIGQNQGLEQIITCLYLSLWNRGRLCLITWIKTSRQNILKISFISKERRVLRKDDGCLVLCHRPCQAMGRNDSLHRAKPSCSLDARQDHPESNRELQISPEQKVYLRTLKIENKRKNRNE